MNIGDRQLNRIWTIPTVLLLTTAVLLAHRILPDNASDLLVQVIQSLHGPGFGTVAIGFLVLTGQSEYRRHTYFKTAFLAMALAGLSEVAQIPGPRDAQFGDLFIDALGITGFLGAHALMRNSVRRSIRPSRLFFAVLACVLTLSITLAPTIGSSYSLVRRTLLFPKILDFESSWERRYSSVPNGDVVIVPAPKDWPVKNSRLGQLRSAGRWGIMLRIFPYPDWREYTAVSFVAASTTVDSVPITFSLRTRGTHETVYQRFRTQLLIGPKPTRYVIPFVDLVSSSGGDSIKLTHVQALVVSESHTKEGVLLLVDDFHLEK